MLLVIAVQMSTERFMETNSFTLQYTCRDCFKGVIQYTLAHVTLIRALQGCSMGTSQPSLGASSAVPRMVPKI